MSTSQSGAAEDGGEPTSPACLVEGAPLASVVSLIATDSVDRNYAVERREVLVTLREESIR